MPEQSNTPSLFDEETEQPAPTNTKSQAKAQRGGQQGQSSKHQKCCCEKDTQHQKNHNKSSFSQLLVASASVSIKSTAAMLTAASCILAAITAVVSIPAGLKIISLTFVWQPTWIILTAVAILSLPPLAALALYFSVRLMRKIIGTVNAGGYAKRAEDDFRFGRSLAKQQPNNRRKNQDQP